MYVNLVNRPQIQPLTRQTIRDVSLEVFVALLKHQAAKAQFS